MSLEAILIILALLSSFGLFIGVIGAQYENIEKANNVLEAKIVSLECVSLAESIFSNSALETSKEFNCAVNGQKIIGKDKVKKETNTFVTIKKEKGLQINAKHYWD